MILKMNPSTKLNTGRVNWRERVSRFGPDTQHHEWVEKSAAPLPPRSGREDRKNATQEGRNAHHPANPYSLCVLVKPRDENADSPSKNWVSGITPLAASRLNHPLPGIVNFVQVLNSENRVRERRLRDGRRRERFDLCVRVESPRSNAVVPR